MSHGRYLIFTQEKIIYDAKALHFLRSFALFSVKFMESSILRKTIGRY